MFITQSYHRLSLLMVLLLAKLLVQAQLCSGSLGDPVVNITFGAGSNPGPSLATTSYTHISTDCPVDGQYSIRNSTGGCFGASWHQLSRDHTGDPNGYFMLVNASFQPGDFFRANVTGLCSNTTYEFAAWVINVLRPFACGGGGNKPNLSFSIETTTGTTLATFNSGDIDASEAPEWKQYGMFFTTPANVSEVVVRLTNNAPGGCGNDLALDDITFRPCGAGTKAVIDGLNSDKLVICAGSTERFQFSATISSGYNDPEMQWQVSGDGGITWSNVPGAQSATLNWQPGEGGFSQYRLIVAERGNINNTSCRIASNPILISVVALPQIVINPLATVCEGSPLRIQATSNLSNGGGTVRWQTPSGTGFTTAEQQQGADRLLLLEKRSAVLADSGMYNLQVTSAQGCVSSQSVRLSVYHKPEAAIQQTGTSCAGSALQLHANASVINSSINGYSWSWGAGNRSAEPAIAPVYTQPGTYPVQLYVTSLAGCSSDTMVQQVQVFSEPVAAFGLPDVCLADPFAPFSDSSEVAGGGALSYRWSFGDAANPGFVATEKNPRYRYPAVGTYPVQLEVTGPGGCVSSITRQFTVNGSRPRSAFTLNNAALRCSDDPVVLRNDASVDFGSITRLEIYWKNDADINAVTIDEQPAPGKEYRFDYSPFLNTATESFSIRVVAYSGATCQNESIQSFTLNKSPEVLFDALTGICQDQPAFALSQGRERDGMSGAGVYSGIGVDGAGRFVPATAGAGNHQLTYRFTTTAGCSDTARQVQTVWPQPLVNAGPDRTLIAGGRIILEATSQGTGLRYQWSPATALNNAQVLQPFASPESDIQYRLTATSTQGCIGVDEVLVRVVDKLFIPNAFTPNGDGNNDTWTVPSLESFPDAEVRVFNRYGQEVFYSKGNNQKWDGRLGGKLMPVGVYVYLVNLKNGTIIKGTVALIR